MKKFTKILRTQHNFFEYMKKISNALAIHRKLDICVHFLFGEVHFTTNFDSHLLQIPTEFQKKLVFTDCLETTEMKISMQVKARSLG